MRRANGKIVKASLAVVGLLAVSASISNADTHNFPKIADQATAIPGGTGNFTTLSQPQVSQGDIVFSGGGSNSQFGIYRYNPATGTLGTVINGNTALPAGESPLNNINSFSVFGPDVSFIVSGGLQNNHLVTTRGGLRKITDAAAVPNFGPGTPTSMDSKGFAFAESYLVNNQITAGFAAATDAGVVTLSPPQLPILRFITRDGVVAYSTNQKFVGTTGQYILSTPSFSQLFSDGGGAPSQQPVGTLLPGQASGYVFAGDVLGGGQPVFSVDDNRNVIFRATAVDLALNRLFSGVFLHPAGGATQEIAINATIIDGFGGFDSFSDVAIDSKVAVFIGHASGTAGIFAAFDANPNSLTELIKTGDTLDGKTASSLTFSSDRPLSGNQLVFTAGFTDGSSGLFLANVPEPSKVALLVIAAMPALERRRARR